MLEFQSPSGFALILVVATSGQCGQRRAILLVLGTCPTGIKAIAKAEGARVQLAVLIYHHMMFPTTILVQTGRSSHHIIDASLNFAKPKRRALCFEGARWSDQATMQTHKQEFTFTKFVGCVQTGANRFVSDAV